MELADAVNKNKFDCEVLVYTLFYRKVFLGTYGLDMYCTNMCQKPKIKSLELFVDNTNLQNQACFLL